MYNDGMTVTQIDISIQILKAIQHKDFYQAAIHVIRLSQDYFYNENNSHMLDIIRFALELAYEQGGGKLDY